MSRIHYFQHYSQKENVVTNNTLLLFSRLYNHSLTRFEDFLNALSGDDQLNVEVGMQFFQQQGNAKGTSVPDGLMTQKSMKVVVETKLQGGYSRAQLQKHLDSFASEEIQVLLLLDPRPPKSKFLATVNTDISAFNTKKEQQVSCLATTFSDIILHFDSVLFDYDIELNEVLEDYRLFCESMNLLPRDEFKMRAVVAGKTFEDNMKFGVYYQPVKRGFATHEYLGLYKNKSVRGIGKVSKIVCADYDKSLGEFVGVSVEKGDPMTTDEEKRVIDIIKQAGSKHGWNIYTGFRFFITDEFEETDYNKSTKYPLQSAKFFDLGKVLELDDLPDCTGIATSLKKLSWS